MKPRSVHVLIMAGGSGTRFWPRSRKGKPKQLLALWDDRALLNHTLSRCEKISGVECFWIVTAGHLVEPSKDALKGRDLKRVRFLAEPLAKNTAPCILWGLREISNNGGSGAVAVVVPADSYVKDESAFCDAIEAAVKIAASQEAFVTLGVKPTRPETGYGYIELSDQKEPGAIAVGRKVGQFVEKPDRATAERYVASTRFLWNAGMFVFPVSFGLGAFQSLMPSLYGLFESSSDVESIYPKIPREDATSFDYAIMERALERGLSVRVVPVDCGWNDVGSFAALEEIGKADLGEVIGLESPGNIAQTDKGVIALLGVRDLVVVRDGEVVMVAPKSRAQDIKALLDEVRKHRPDLA